MKLQTILLKKIVLYGVSTAINRGLPLFFMPILTSYLSLAQFGTFSLAQTIVTLLGPVLSLGGGHAVLREGAEDLAFGRNLFLRFFMWAIAISLGLVVLTLVLPLPGWWVWIAFLSGLEAHHFLIISQLRSEDKDWEYFFFCLLKAILVFLAFYFAGDLVSALKYQTLAYAVIAGGFFVFLAKDVSVTKWLGIRVAGVLGYSLFMLPQGVAQWIMSSADRMIIELLIGSEPLGVYSICYNISLSLMIVNSGIALAAPSVYF